jgi:hypothetical protein
VCEIVSRLSVSLGFLIAPEIRKVINNFADQIISEADFQFINESWASCICIVNLYSFFKKFTAVHTEEKIAPSKLYAMVLYDLVASESDQISLIKGHIITVLEKTEDIGWWMGVDEKGDGKQGYFPSNYVKLLPPENFLATKIKNDKENFLDSALVTTGAPVYGWMVSLSKNMPYLTLSLLVHLHFCFILNIVAFFVQENCNLLRVEVDDDDTPPPYARSDICEVEPEVVLGLLRILVHFVRLLEKQVISLQKEVTDKGTERSAAGSQKSMEQRVSTLKTLQSFSSQLLPWVLVVIETAFFTNEKVVAHVPPRMLIDSLDRKLKSFMTTVASLL